MKTFKGISARHLPDGPVAPKWPKIKVRSGRFPCNEEGKRGVPKRRYKYFNAGETPCDTG